MRRREQELLRLADALWEGDADHREWNRALDGGARLPLAEDVVFIGHRGIVGNVLARRTEQGIVLIDTGDPAGCGRMHELLREWDERPVCSIVYTHGHVDHVSGAPVYDDEADRQGWSRPQVIAHRNLPRRFERYRLTEGWNRSINGRQFERQARDFRWPEVFRDPDTVFDGDAVVDYGGVEMHLHHGRGETEDHVWVEWPDLELVHSGDFVIWAAPNCGNPQKVQRYVHEWAVTLRRIRERRPKILVPGHGPPVFGADRIDRLLDETATFLEDMHDQTVEAMNAGCSLAEVLARVAPREDLLQRPYLRPIYDDPSFVVRNLWRLYGGWYDGEPDHLEPPSPDVLGREICDLAGGIDPLLDRVQDLLEAGELAVASSLVEMAVAAAPESTSAHSLRAAIYERRSSEQTVLMSRGIYAAAAARSRRETGAS